jgi:succinate dehydrogenase / fumarate reductase, flavoprotein subunit
MNIISQHDILIVGAGAAGIRAAIEIAELNPKKSVALISKVYPLRSHTVAAEGGVAAVISSDDSNESHIIDTIKGSDYLADQDAVEFFVKSCKKEILKLNNWGCVWSRTPEGKIAVRAFGGMSKKRTVYAADKTGLHILHNLFERLLLHEQVKRYDEWFVTKILADNKGVKGLAAINQKDGQLYFFQAPTVIIATGGAGQIYKNTTNSSINTGDGTALAYKIGVTLKDMEFIQFHPTALPGTGILISEAARGEGGYLLNKKNERFLKKYTSKMELESRDKITRAIINEFQKGNGFKGQYGNYMHLDIKHLGEKTINEKLPQIRELAIKYTNKDPIKTEIPITPAQHFFMGGIHTNQKGETSMPGLYAVGEASCVSIHGANRLGSNSLAKCLVFGCEVGKNALEFSNKTVTRTISKTEIKTSEKEIQDIFNSNGKENVYELTDQMKNCMEENAGIIRDEKSLLKGIEEIKKIKEKSNTIAITQKNAIHNNDLIRTLELKNMLLLAETILKSASFRKESRGSHYRLDFQKRNDENFLSHTLITKSDAGNKIDLLPVTITKWNPK